MRSIDPEKYGPTLAELLREPHCAPLGPGTPNSAAKPLLDKLSATTVLAPATVRDADMAACCLAGLWLYHDFLDESHRICQDVGTPSGSYWHAVVHRREPDFSNSKYWFHRAGGHPVFPDLCQAAVQLATAEPAAPGWLKVQSAWDPFAFVDLCEAAQSGRQAAESLCRAIQQAEWELLFDYCYRQAIGG
jgi:hypothetical protein